MRRCALLASKPSQSARLTTSNSLANYSFATFASFSNQTTTSPAQYFLYDFPVGTNSNASTITTTLGFTNIDNSRFPVGTIFFAFLEEGAGAENDVKKVTPFDNNVMIVTPEPGTLSLLSLGLVSIGILVRRRMRHA